MPEWMSVSQPQQQNAFHLPEGDFDIQGQEGQNNGEILLVRSNAFSV